MPPRTTEAEEERTCPRCGERNPRQFPVCWNCQEALPDGELADDAEPSVSSVSSPRATPLEHGSTSWTGRGARELYAVVLALWVPTFISAIQARYAPPPPITLASSLYQIPMALGFTALIAHLSAPDGGWVRKLGLVRPRILPELGLGLALAVFILVCSTFAALVQRLIDPQVASMSKHFESGTALWLAPLNLLLWVVWEEVFFRAYLWTRLSELTRRPVLALVLASALFSVGHAYPLAPSVAIFAGGLMLGTVYCTRRSLWAPILGHWLFNLWTVYG